MSNRRSIVMLLLLTLAACAANYLHSLYVQTGSESADTTLFAMSGQPTRISIERKGCGRTALMKDDKWHLVAPHAGRVDDKIVLEFLDALVTASPSDSLSPGELAVKNRQSSDFGLEDPCLRVLLGNARESVAVSFGSVTPATNGVYASVTGSDAVYVLPFSVYERSNRTGEDFRQKDIFPYAPQSVLSFEVRRPGKQPVLVARDGKLWKTEGRIASEARVGDLLSMASDLRVSRFVWPVVSSNAADTISSPLLSGCGLDPDTAITLTLHYTDGSFRSLSFGNAAGEKSVYALVHDGGEIVTVDATVRDAVSEAPTRLADWRVFPVAESEVRSFSIQIRDVGYVVARSEDGAWRMDSPVVAPADGEMARQVLDRILALTDADLGETGIGVSVNTNSSAKPIHPDRILGDRHVDELRSREILKIDPLVVRRLVSTPAAQTNASSVVYDRERRVWNVDAGSVGGVVGDAAVQSVLAALNPLNAEMVVTLCPTPESLALYGLEKPYHTLAIDQEIEGSVRRNVLIGAETVGGRYATVGSSDAVFVISDSVVRKLTVPLVEAVK